MAIHIKDIKQSIRLLKETQKIFRKLGTFLPMSDVYRLSVRIDKFLTEIKEIDSEGQNKETRG